MAEDQPMRLLIEVAGGAAPAAMAAPGIKPLMPAVDGGRAAAAGPGIAAAQASQWYLVDPAAAGAALAGGPALSAGASWDQCHALVSRGGLGFAPGQILHAEPDLPQRFVAGPPADAPLPGFAAKASPRTGPNPVPQDKNYPREPEDDWYQDTAHGHFAKALAELAVLSPERRSPVRVAHLDTGYGPEQIGRMFRLIPVPASAHLAMEGAIIRTDLARNFVDAATPNSAVDTSGGLVNNRGHGTGTLSILGAGPLAAGGVPVGAAPFIEVVPLRVANRVELFWTSAIAQALDHVLALCGKDATRIDVVTMSMGGLPSRAWADAVNALYEAGVFVVTAAGNNYANLPTRGIVYPARFNRVVAACGVMADGKPYSDLAFNLMAGNYGPPAKMPTAMAAHTPNVPWLRLGAEGMVDHDGAGTSAATPQVAAAAAIWLSANQPALAGHAGWQKVEAIRSALFGGARAHPDTLHFGRGLLDAEATLHQPVAASATLAQAPVDSVSFPLIRLLGDTGSAMAAPQEDAALALEALQLLQDRTIEPAVEALDTAGADQKALKDSQARIRLFLLNHPAASARLRACLAPAVAARSTHIVSDQHEAAQLGAALDPTVETPLRRRLRIFASDPSLTAVLETARRAVATVEVAWETLAPGPVGEYLEVVDIDPATRAAYAPVDLEDRRVIATAGLTPAENDPRFHQQMVYAVAMRTIEAFERALGRKAQWSSYRRKTTQKARRGGPPVPVWQEDYVQHLRIYPHALRTANAYYSPDKKALLFGYFRAPAPGDRTDVARPMVFAALAHDIVAHETAHALLDGLHRRYIEASNPDCAAFHEAFADLVAIFLHFAVPDAVGPEIAATRGDLNTRNRLGELAVQFGLATGSRGALRSYIGDYDANGVWTRHAPQLTDYAGANEAHDRGAVLVAAVFDAFLEIYTARAHKLIELATGGSGVLPEGELTPPVVEALTGAACRLAHAFLDIVIRALDYCPPFDITFGEYLRAMITADRDLVPDDDEGFRVTIARAFRARGISPTDVNSVTPDALGFDPPEAPDSVLDLSPAVANMELDWSTRAPRKKLFDLSKINAASLHDWLAGEASDALLALLGIERKSGPMALTVATDSALAGLVPGGRDSASCGQVTIPGHLHGFEVHSVRTLRRVGPDRNVRNDLIIEITQRWEPDHPDLLQDGVPFRGGCTVIVGRSDNRIRYVLRKRITRGERYAAQRAFHLQPQTGLAATYQTLAHVSEPFAAAHARFGQKDPLP